MFIICSNGEMPADQGRPPEHAFATSARPLRSPSPGGRSASVLGSCTVPGRRGTGGQEQCDGEHQYRRDRRHQHAADEKRRRRPTHRQKDERDRLGPTRHGTLLVPVVQQGSVARSEEHTSELQSLMRISYAVFCLKKKTKTEQHIYKQNEQH